MFNQPNLSVIIVNYKSEHLLNQCIASLKHIPNSYIEYIVVNNSPNNFECPEKNSATIQNERNIGFGSAANQGARVASAPYLLFLNPDTRWHSGDIQNTVCYMEKHPEIAIIGSRLLSTKNVPQPWNCGSEVTVYDIIRNNILTPKSKPFWESETLRTDVAWVSGGALFARTEDFFAIDGFDENFFLYFEDVDLCRRMRQKSKLIAFDPKIRFTHIGGGSFGKNIRKQKKHYYQSQRYYIQKHFGTGKANTLKLLHWLTKK